MSPHRAFVLASAAIAVIGLVFLGWSATEVLALYWVETAVLLLAPWVAVLASAPTAARGERVVAALFGLVPLVLSGAYLALYGFAILFVGTLQPIALGDGMTVVGSTSGHVQAALSNIATSPAFLASALAIAGLAIADYRAALRATRGTAGAPLRFRLPFARIALLHVVLTIGAAIVGVLQFPSAAALLLVVLKLALDLRGGTHANPYLAPAEERT